MVSWSDAVRISREHGKFWGIGLGNYAVYSDAVIFTALAHRSRLSSAHGMYLQMLAEQGIPGLLAWAGFFTYLLLYFYRHFRRSQIPAGRALNLWCFLLTAMFAVDGLMIMSLLPPGHSHEALTAGYYVWVIWGLGVAWNRMTQERAADSAAAPGASA
jgi:O-antigen ligase